MSEEKKELKKNLKNEELCEGKQKLSIEELKEVTGGNAWKVGSGKYFNNEPD